MNEPTGDTSSIPSSLSLLSASDYGGCCKQEGDYNIFVVQASSYINRGLYHRCHFCGALWIVCDYPFF